MDTEDTLRGSAVIDAGANHVWHLSADWCPVEGRLSQGPRADGTCGVCGSSLDRVALPVPDRGDAASSSDAGPAGVFSPQVKAADRLRWPYFIMATLMGIHIVLSVFEIWIVAEWSTDDTTALMAVIGIEDITLLIFLAAGITFVAWSTMAHSNLDVFGRLDQTHSHRAAIWWWVAPLANLVMPYRVMFETVRGSEAPAGEPAWKETALPRIAMWWTGMFIAAQVLDSATFTFFEEAFLSGDFGTFRLTVAVVEVIWTSAAALVIVMMRRVNRAQSELASRWADPQSHPFGGPSPDRRAASFLGPFEASNGDGQSPVI